MRFDAILSGDDGAWDAFAQQAPGGDYRQSVGWAALKSLLGRRTARFALAEGGSIVAGAQVLLRRVGPLAIGYVPRGPLALDGSSPAAVLDTVLSEARRAGIHALGVALPRVAGDWEPLLAERGMDDAGVEVAPSYTTVVDLAAPADVLLDRMRPKTRYNIRVAERRGVTVRQGGAGDVDSFCRLYEQAGGRIGFDATESRAYFRTLWTTLGEAGQARLFLASAEGVTLSAIIVIGFGDTATYYRGAWSGSHGNLHPNEAVQWAAMRWAKSTGYRFYDFEDISPEAAHELAETGALPRETDPLSYFKVGFGGDVLAFPPTKLSITAPAVRRGYRFVRGRPRTRRVAAAIIDRLRNLEGGG